MSAPPPTRTLTKVEFEQLLQRAAERDVFREPRLFSLPELVAAGEELGLAPASVADVYAEYQHELQRPPARPRPVGSNLWLQKSDDILFLRVPPSRLGLGKKLAIAGAPIGALYGALATGHPLWALGPATAFLGSMTMHWLDTRLPGYELGLHRDGSGTLTRLLGWRRHTLHLVPGQLHARLVAVTADDGRRTEVMVLDHGTRSFQTLEFYTHVEQAWVVEEIERWLGR
jgi:hypothetical protein